eukprot:TRINITY_DN38170_c0_g1_i1.p1 TRINITY_DN38170_c0_g1~~TRINITY_DN38170_c0_g1_i1.p1  ORF type:complete len:472 (-),score=117.67 TRINITY_DN38170_c0_g1_i1:372-1787(-)
MLHVVRVAAARRSIRHAARPALQGGLRPPLACGRGTDGGRVAVLRRWLAQQAAPGSVPAERLAVWNWKYTRLAFRAVRASAIAASLYGLGYASGMHAYAADPDGVKAEWIRNILKTTGAVDANGKPMLCDADGLEAQAVRRVLPHLLKAAREEVEEMVVHAKQKVLAGEMSDTEFEDIVRSKAMLKNWRDDGFLVLDVNTPNAFVHGMCPGCIFVCKGIFSFDRLEELTHKDASVGLAVAVRSGEELVKCRIVELVSGRKGCIVEDNHGVRKDVTFDDVMRIDTQQLIETDDQLAMLLGHELSHIIHDHSEDSFRTSAMVQGMKLVTLSVLDPTGFLTFVVEIFGHSFATYAIELPVSRAAETEADHTGLQICARALYDPRKATTFFDSLLKLEMTEGRGGGWGSTHPATEDRSAAMHAAEDHAMKLFNAELQKRENAKDRKQRLETERQQRRPGLAWPGAPRRSHWLPGL